MIINIDGELKDIFDKYYKDICLSMLNKLINEVVHYAKKRKEEPWQIILIAVQNVMAHVLASTYLKMCVHMVNKKEHMDFSESLISELAEHIRTIISASLENAEKSDVSYKKNKKTFH